MASLRRGESEKLKKGWKHAAGTDLLKRVSWHFFFFFFFYFFFFFFFQILSFLHSEIILIFGILFYTFEEKTFLLP